MTAAAPKAATAPAPGASKSPDSPTTARPGSSEATAPATAATAPGSSASHGPDIPELWPANFRQPSRSFRDDVASKERGSGDWKLPERSAAPEVHDAPDEEVDPDLAPAVNPRTNRNETVSHLDPTQKDAVRTLAELAALAALIGLMFTPLPRTLGLPDILGRERSKLNFKKFV